MRGCSYAAAATLFQNFTTTPPTWPTGRIEFWNPPPQIHIGALSSQTLVGGCTDAGFLSNFVSIRRNSLLRLSSSESQVELEIANEDEIPAHLPDQDDSPTVRIRLELRRECQFGEQFLVAGEHPNLGLWSPLDAAPMIWSDGHVWTTELDLPAGKLIQFKFIFRNISGEILWQPGPNRVLHTQETGKITVVFGEWEEVAVQQVTEERKGDNQYEESDELVIHKLKQLRNDGAESNSKKDKPYYNSCTADLNGKGMSIVAENIEHDTLEVQERGYTRRKDIFATIHDIPVLVPGLTPCIIIPSEDATAQLELDAFDNARNIITENSEAECLHYSGKNQIQLDKNEEEIGRYREKMEGEEEAKELISELMFDKEHHLIDYPSSHEPGQGLQLTFFEEQGKRNKGILYNNIKWCQQTLRRFLDKMGFRLQ